MSLTKSDAVAEVAAALRRHAILLRNLHRKVLRDSLSMAQVALLQFIAERQRTTPTEIAQFTGLTGGTVTALLDSLERDQYVVRTRSTEDRRSVWVTLTERAAKYLDELAGEAQHEIARLFDDWSLTDMMAFTSFLDRLNHSPMVEVNG